MKDKPIDYTQPERKVQVRQQLAENVMVLTFEKSNGQVRHMTATLHPDVIPPVKSTSGAGPHNENLQVVWDTETGAWRSFRWERLLSSQVLEPVVSVDLTELGK